MVLCNEPQSFFVVAKNTKFGCAHTVKLVSKVRLFVIFLRDFFMRDDRKQEKERER